MYLFAFIRSCSSRLYGGERASERVRAPVRSCEFIRVSEEIHETHLIYCGKLFASLKNRNNNRTARNSPTRSFILSVSARSCVCVREFERTWKQLVFLSPKIYTSIESILKWAEHRRHGLCYYVCAFKRFSTCARIFYTLPFTTRHNTTQARTTRAMWFVRCNRQMWAIRVVHAASSKRMSAFI